MNCDLTLAIRNFIIVALYRSAGPYDCGVGVQHFDGHVGYLLWIGRKRPRFDVFNIFFLAANGAIRIHQHDVIGFQFSDRRRIAFLHYAWPVVFNSR